jgi:hypothetical protein
MRQNGTGASDPGLAQSACAYNAAATLAEQLEALAAQRYDGDWELVIVDNGPPTVRGSGAALPAALQGVHTDRQCGWPSTARSAQPPEPLCEDIAPARSFYRRTRGPQDGADPISRSVELSRPPSENLHPPGAQSGLVGEERSYLLEPVLPGFMKDPRRVTEGFRSLEVALSGCASDNRNRPAD